MARTVATRPMDGDSIVISRPDENTCHCGCEEPTAKNRRFRQGHDARLRGILGRAHLAGHGVIFVHDGVRDETSAAQALRNYDFPVPTPRKRATKAAGDNGGSTRKATGRVQKAARPAKKTAAKKTGGRRKAKS